MLCDPRNRERVVARGESPEANRDFYIDAVNEILRDRPAGMTVCMHMCRGNFESNWNGEGGYEAVAEKMFANLKVDGFFMEWDNDRSGGFEPLRYLPRMKKVVLGLVSTKKPELESKDDLKRRIDEAAKYVPLENLCLSPQCGFASTILGNKLTEDDQRRKLELVVETSCEIWRTA